MTKQWDAELARRVGQAVKRLRESAQPKMSAAKLAERTTECGYPLSKAQISDLELGRKKTVTVPELISLAVALELSPAELLYPDLPNGTVEAWPGVEMTNIEAAQWFSGLEPAHSVDHSVRNKRIGNVDRINLARQYHNLDKAVRKANLMTMKARVTPDAVPVSADEADRQYEAAKEMLEKVTAEIRAAGWPVDDA